MAIKIAIKEFELRNNKIDKLKVYISLNIFNKIDIIKVKLDKNRIEKLLSKNNKNIKFKKLKVQALKETISKIEIENVNIYAQIGTLNPISTAFLVALISSATAIILATKTKNPKYKVEPIYIGKNYLYLSINCIFKIKLVHIINISKKVKKEGDVPK